ncbi:MAG: hypothetical protein ACXAEI_16445, partial [Candidatus Hodarchaeales archaeon]
YKGSSAYRVRLRSGMLGCTVEHQWKDGRSYRRREVRVIQTSLRLARVIQRLLTPAGGQRVDAKAREAG